eukprot:INCI18093.3.p1 GENE.INCI18093.3~~INCI18093.3.p1  ORF type:complete len:171 (+),score=25.40 INCI18093.3:113-625(+)
MPSQSPQGKEASKPAPSLAAPKKRKVARLSVHPPALPCPTCGHCKRPGKRRLTQREDDARRVRTALQDFFHFRIQGARSQAVAKDGAESGAAPPVSRRRQGGRNPEPIRRLGDTLLTILLMDPDMEESVVARCVACLCSGSSSLLWLLLVLKPARCRKKAALREPDGCLQ